MDDSGQSMEAPNLGFLTVLQEGSGYVGGYLVTNLCGRPLEFRVSTAVQPNRVQQILYGETLKPYVCADLIGKTLLDKTSIPAQFLITDREVLLALREKVAVPVIWLSAGRKQDTSSKDHVCNPRFPQDDSAVDNLMDRLRGRVDLHEPFSRIREAMGEARKMGGANRG